MPSVKRGYAAFTRAPSRLPRRLHQRSCLGVYRGTEIEFGVARGCSGEHSTSLSALRDEAPPPVCGTPEPEEKGSGDTATSGGEVYQIDRHREGPPPPRQRRANHA